MQPGRVVITGTMSLCLAVAGLVVADVADAAASTRYVATTGSDAANDCRAEATPCLTIQHAVDAAAAGDTVSIGAGTFVGAVTVPGIDITIRGVSATETVLSGPGGDFVTGVSFGAAAGAITTATIADLTVRGFDGTGITGTRVALAVTKVVVDNNAYGGVRVAGGSLALTDSSVSNSANSNQPTDGVVGYGADVAVLRSSISGIDGVGLSVNAGGATPTATVDDSTVSRNNFGGIAVGGAVLSVDSSTVTGNSGFGILSSGSSTTVTRSTITDTAQLFGENGSGLVVVPQQERARRAAPAPGITVSGSIVSSAPGSGVAADCSGAVTDGGHNLSSDDANSCAFSAGADDIVRTDPVLGEPADNGGPTLTRLPATTSPVLDAIPAGTAGCAANETDQRGETRLSGPGCDIGAVERASSVPVPPPTPPVTPVRITTTSLPDGQVGGAYRKALAATGGDGDYVWTLADGSALPAGLSLNRAGVITGTPTRAGTYSVTVLADGASRRFTLEVAAAATGPNDVGADPIAKTGAPSGQLTAWGSALVLLGFVVLLAAGQVGRRPGRHRPI